MTSIFYTVKAEYLPLWGEDTTDETIITEAELHRLSVEWEKPVLELEEQLDKHERHDISIDNGQHYVPPEEALEWIPMSTIAVYMDDDARETAARLFAPCSDIYFLYRYLEVAPADLIIG